MNRYAKMIAALPAAIAGVTPLLIEAGVAVPAFLMDTAWLSGLVAFLTPIAVYAVPNADR